MRELRVIQPSYAPVRNLMLYLTEDCNLRCTYCFVKKSPRSMSIETAHKTVDYFFHRNISGNRRDLWITFFGGEPFMAQDLMEEIIGYARGVAQRTRKNIQFSATTNATFATPRVERIIRDTQMPLLVSVDGGEDAMAERPFLGGGSPYRAVRRNLPRLVEWSPKVIARMTYHPEALDLCANVRRVLDMGATSIALCPVNESDWRGFEQKLEDAHQALASWFIEEAIQERYLPLEITWQQLRSVHHSTRGGSRPVRPCEVGTTLIAVDPDGHVMPCHRYLYRPKDWFGTVEEPSFPPQRETYVKLSSRELLGCETCVAEPICGGGCRYLAITEGHDIRTGTHPGYCLNTRAQARAAYRIYQTLMERIPHQFTNALHHYRSPADLFGELSN